ncbi:Short-chain dehydrogenase/reductase SDR [Corchorus capsularis]|uniref:Short-chain dehydrogenase/reductase SDR n=1 Tax=Corchorus capsularis TaxID=210143 RepID=A0A1R3KGL0_COCAP|nr:Short-chain dehydrogenase/reductase SDR [Corchorus capsularis]
MASNSMKPHFVLKPFMSQGDLIPRIDIASQAVKAFGQIDILVNNAAEQYKASSAEEIDEQRLERVFRTNIFSYFFMTRATMPTNSSILSACCFSFLFQLPLVQ